MRYDSLDDDPKDRVRVQRILFLAFFGLLFLLAARLIKPFFTVILWSSLVYGFTQPLYKLATVKRSGEPRGRLPGPRSPRHSRPARSS